MGIDPGRFIKCAGRQVCTLALAFLLIAWTNPASPQDSARDLTTEVRHLAKTYQDCMDGNLRRAHLSSSIKAKSSFRVPDLSPQQLDDPSFVTEQERADMLTLHEHALDCRPSFLSGLRRTSSDLAALVVWLYRTGDDSLAALIAGRISWGEFNQNRARLLEEFLPAWQAGFRALKNETL